MKQITKAELESEIKKGARRNKLALRRVVKQMGAKEAEIRELWQDMYALQRERLIIDKAIKENEE